MRAGFGGGWEWKGGKEGEKRENISVLLFSLAVTITF